MQTASIGDWVEGKGYFTNNNSQLVELSTLMSMYNFESISITVMEFFVIFTTTIILLMHITTLSRLRLYVQTGYFIRAS